MMPMQRKSLPSVRRSSSNKLLKKVRTYMLKRNYFTYLVLFSSFVPLMNYYFLFSAIRVEETTKSVADSLDIESMTIEDKYDGPRLHDDKNVTLEFMEKLLQHYKDRQLLHRRYAFQMLLDIRQYFMSQPTLGNYNGASLRMG